MHPHDSSVRNAVSLLKGGALLFCLIGFGIIAWCVKQWVEHPEMQASQLGNTAPYWPALIVFVLVSVAAGVGLLWRAAQRLEAGEDLFAQRHRKSLKEFQEKGFDDREGFTDEETADVESRGGARTPENGKSDAGE